MIAGEHSIRRNTALAFAVNMTAAAFTAALTLFLVRALGPHDYGVYALALSIAALLTLPSDLGISSAAARFVAERRGDRAGVTEILVDALKLKLLIASAVALGLFAAAGAVAAAYDEPGLLWPLRAMAAVLFSQSILQLVGGTFTAQGRIVANLWIALSASTVELLTAVSLVLLGGGAAGAAFGRTAGWAVALVVGLTLLGRFLGRSAFAGRRTTPNALRRIAAYASGLALVEVSFALFDQVGAVLIGAFLGSAAVGMFQAPMRLLAFLHLPGLAVANAVAPRLARHARVAPNIGALLSALRWVILLQTLFAAPLLVWSEPVVGLLLGAEYDDSIGLLRILTPYMFLSGLAPLLSLTVNYLGRARRRIPIAVGALAINVTLAAILIPTIGVEGAALGSVAGFLLYVPGHFWLCRQALGFPVLPLAKTLVRALLAGAAAAGVLWAFGTEELALREWLGGAVLAPAAFVAVLLATRELTAADLKQLAARVQARRRRG